LRPLEDSTVDVKYVDFQTNVLSDDDKKSRNENDAFHFVDAVADELNGEEEEEEEDILLCNSVRMIREKLKIEGSLLQFNFYYFLLFLLVFLSSSITGNYVAFVS